MNKKKQLIRQTKKSKEAQLETNVSAHNKIQQQAGQMNCKYCPPWEHENKVQRKAKRGAKKPRYKDKRSE